VYIVYSVRYAESK